MKQNWAYKKLGELATITMGQSPTSDTYNESEGLPFFQGNADFGKVHPNVRIYCNAPIRIADNGDVLISVRAPIGAINIADRKCCIGRGLAAIRGEEKNQSRFIYYLLLASKEKLVAQGTGSTFKSIGKDALYNLLMPFVPLSTQSRIVSELDLLQSLIDKQQAQLKEYDTLAQSIFYDMFGDPVENEKGWEVSHYGAEFEIGAGGTPSTKVAEYWNDGTIPWIGSNMCQNRVIYETDGKFITEEGLKHSSAKMLEPNTVLVALVGATIGKVALLKTQTTTNQNIAFIKQSHKFSPTFVFYHMMSLYDEFMKLGNGDFKMANQGFIKTLPIILPPLPLQQSFAAKIESIERQKATISKSIAETEKLFEYTMDKYFG